MGKKNMNGSKMAKTGAGPSNDQLGENASHAGYAEKYDNKGKSGGKQGRK